MTVKDCNYQELKKTVTQAEFAKYTNKNSRI